MNFGHAIRTIRKELGVTQAELSLRTGISQTSLSKIEGKKMEGQNKGDGKPPPRPTDANVKKISEALGVPEIVLYVLASEASDIPADKKDNYRMLQSVVKNLARELVDLKHKELLK